MRASRPSSSSCSAATARRGSRPREISTMERIAPVDTVQTAPIVVTSGGAAKTKIPRAIASVPIRSQSNGGMSRPA